MPGGSNANRDAGKSGGGGRGSYGGSRGGGGNSGKGHSTSSRRGGMKLTVGTNSTDPKDIKAVEEVKKAFEDMHDKF